MSTRFGSLPLNSHVLVTTTLKGDRLLAKLSNPYDKAGMESILRSLAYHIFELNNITATTSVIYC